MTYKLEDMLNDCSVIRSTVERSEYRTMRKVKLVWKEFASLEGFIRLILLVDWDPIGIFGYPAAMNEYDSYAPPICSLLVSGATQTSLAAHLREIENKQMGMTRSHTDCEAIAEKLLTVYATWQRDRQIPA